MYDFTTYKKKILSEQVEEQIADFIAEERIELGDKLPNEFILAERFGVGRSTLREAVKSLVARGMLEVRHGSGTYVKSLMSRNDDPLKLHGVDDKLSLAMDLVDVRLLLEPEIAALAAINATEKDIEILEALCSEVEEKILQGKPYVNSDIAFHTFIAKCSKNIVMEQLVPIIDTGVMLFINVTHKSLKVMTIDTHRAIVNSIKSRDSIGARTAMQMHLIYNRDKIKEIKEQEGSGRLNKEK